MAKPQTKKRNKKYDPTKLDFISEKIAQTKLSAFLFKAKLERALMQPTKHPRVNGMDVVIVPQKGTHIKRMIYLDNKKYNNKRIRALEKKYGVGNRRNITSA